MFLIWIRVIIFHITAAGVEQSGSYFSAKKIDTTASPSRPPRHCAIPQDATCAQLRGWGTGLSLKPIWSPHFIRWLGGGLQAARGDPPQSSRRPAANSTNFPDLLAPKDSEEACKGRTATGVTCSRCPGQVRARPEGSQTFPRTGRDWAVGESWVRGASKRSWVRRFRGHGWESEGLWVRGVRSHGGVMEGK